MATFVVIPPRECLENALAEFVGRVLPGVKMSPAVSEAFLASLEFEANRNDDTYFVHREDLPGQRDTVGDLIDLYGAEAGDHIVEIGNAAGGKPATTRRCSVKVRGALLAGRASDG
jgi:hypothetical protein